ncbi:hypothetical protein HYZ64_02530 [Candidatus Berkelbacteria bacterium]|nr:hypothetical protein [Candidatus Berkelbacteria bacterium]
MKVVLTKDVDKVGRLGDTIEVKDGFAINWLLPQGLALRQDSRFAKHLVRKRGYLDHKAKIAAEAPHEVTKSVPKSMARLSEQRKKDEKKVKQSRRLDVTSRVGTPTAKDASGLKPHSA